MRTIPLLCLTVVLAASAAATTMTTVQNGLWHDPETWGMEGVYPDNAVDVVILHDVDVRQENACRNLTIEAGGRVFTGYGYRKLFVHGDAVILGAISGSVGGWPLEVIFYGDLELHGELTPSALEFGGTEPNHIVLGPDAVIAPQSIDGTGCPGLVADTVLRLNTSASMAGATIQLMPGTGLELQGGFLNDVAIACGGNPVTSSGGGSFGGATLDDAELYGLTRCYTGVVFTGTTTVHDTLQTDYGNVEVTCDDIVNLGVIRDGDWELMLRVRGDVTHRGDAWTGRSLTFVDAGAAHAWTQDAGSRLEVEYLDLAAGSGPLTLHGDAVVTSVADLGGGELRLATGASLSHEGGRLEHGAVVCGGATITGDGAVLLRDLTVTDARLAGDLQLGNDVRLAGLTTVAGTVRNQVNASVTATAAGLLVNEGTITGSLTLDLEGDLDNRGVWNNVLTRMIGTADQHAACDDAQPVGGTLRLVSNLGGDGHQWFHEGWPWPGGDEPQCDLAPAATPHHGLWRCTSSAGASRRIILGTTATGIGAPAPAAAFTGPSPNPFNPSTEIRFSLDAPGRVRLEVLDLRGRRVAVLQDGELDAGPHVRRWDASGRPSGAYLFRLTTPAGVVQGRGLLVK